MYYFKYEHKVEMIPYIEQEVQQYLNYLKRQLPNLDNDKKIKVKKLLMKKQKQIEEFFQRVFVDYRAPLIMRIKKILYSFLVQNAHMFPRGSESMDGGIKSEKIQKEEKMQKVQKLQKIQKRENTMKKSSEDKLQKISSISVKKPSQSSFKNLNKSISGSIEKEKQQQKQKQKKKEKSPKIGISPQKSQQKTIETRAQKLKSPQSSLKKQPKPVIKKTTTQITRKLTKDEFIQYLKNKQQK